MDALQALLGAKPVSEITEEVNVKRLGTKFTIKALSDEEIDSARLQATRTVRNGKKTEQQVNATELTRILVVQGTVKPDFKNAELMTHYKATDAVECVKNALLPGEIVGLQDAILAISGFGDLDEEVDEVKN